MANLPTTSTFDAQLQHMNVDLGALTTEFDALIGTRPAALTKPSNGRLAQAFWLIVASAVPLLADSLPHLSVRGQDLI